MKQRISVVIPVYNMADTVCRAIDSVINQTYCNTEVIVVDDGSTDATASVVRSAYPMLNYMRIEHTGLAGVVRNVGARSTSGALLAFLDADDYWERDVLEHLALCFENDTKVGLAYGCLQYQGGEHDGKYVQDFRMPLSGYVFDELVKKNFIPMHPALVKKELFEQIGGFDCSLKMAMDYDLWLRISQLCKVQYTSLAKGYYCISPESNFHRTDLLSRNMHLYRIMIKFVQNANQGLPSVLRRLAVVSLTICMHSFKKKYFLKTLKYAFLTGWYSLRYWCKKEHNARRNIG